MASLEWRVKYVPVEIDKGYFYCDLVGFGMTLIDKKLFEKLQEPYFIYDVTNKEDNYLLVDSVEAYRPRHDTRFKEDMPLRDMNHLIWKRAFMNGSPRA